MPGIAGWIQGHQFLLTAIIGAAAWLTGKAWEPQTSRRARYAEVVALLALLARTDTADVRDQSTPRCPAVGRGTDFRSAGG